MHRRMRVFDIFSGIGGFSLALRKSCRSIAYCEIDDISCAILRANMKKGHLDSATIYPDIHSLDVSKIQRLKPEGATMGFPCQDISGAGRGLGIHGPKSSLFFIALDKLRQIDTIQWILMENSPFIVQRGLGTIENTLRILGFSFKWIILSAADVGAPQQRRRWFGLAWRGTCPSFVPYSDMAWRSEPVRRLCKLPDRCARSVARKRCERLGNAVVPQCVKAAVHLLSSSRPRDLHSLFESRKILVFNDGTSHFWHKQYWSTPISSPRSLNQTCTNVARVFLSPSCYMRPIHEEFFL